MALFQLQQAADREGDDRFRALQSAVKDDLTGAIHATAAIKAVHEAI